MKLSQLKLTTPYLELDSVFYEKVEPTPLEKPFLISASQDAAKLLGVDENLYDDAYIVDIINGSKKLEDSQTFAMCYAGHQFGNFVPRLGDGRAINLGKVNGMNLQVKGSGLTLYSRHGDGRAVLRSSIREYLMSEAMHGLGIATSRALALIGSDTDVAREGMEKGAIVLRLCPTWVRFGTFEYFNASKEPEKLQKLADYVINESFPHLKGEDGIYLKMYAHIVKNTAITLAKWMSVGFNHGVMNTDNMSIDGSTIDYGPFAFLDDYEADYICNHTDREGRYSFKKQPSVAQWNLNQLAIAISPIVNYQSSKQILEDVFEATYESHYLEIMYKKLGLNEVDTNDISFIKWMLAYLENARIDYNLFFRKLSVYKGDKSVVLDIAVSRENLSEWLDLYDEKLESEVLSQEQRQERMLAINPKYILKNHILQEAIQKANKNDFTMVNDLLKVAHSPCEEHEDLEYLCVSTPQKSKNSKLSCSS